MGPAEYSEYCFRLEYHPNGSSEDGPTTVTYVLDFVEWGTSMINETRVGIARDRDIPKVLQMYKLPPPYIFLLLIVMRYGCANRKYKKGRTE